MEEYEGSRLGKANVSVLVADKLNPIGSHPTS